MTVQKYILKSCTEKVFTISPNILVLQNCTVLETKATQWRHFFSALKRTTIDKILPYKFSYRMIISTMAMKYLE